MMHILSQNIKKCVQVSAGFAVLKVMSMEVLCSLVRKQKHRTSMEDIPSDVLGETLIPFSRSGDVEVSNSFRATSAAYSSVPRIENRVVLLQKVSAKWRALGDLDADVIREEAQALTRDGYAIPARTEWGNADDLILRALDKDWRALAFVFLVPYDHFRADSCWDAQGRLICYRTFRARFGDASGSLPELVPWDVWSGALETDARRIAGEQRASFLRDDLRIREQTQLEEVYLGGEPCRCENGWPRFVGNDTPPENLPLLSVGDWMDEVGNEILRRREIVVA